jgi:CubicO group peptidase (beta-lactamase class C family)
MRNLSFLCSLLTLASAGAADYSKVTPRNLNELEQNIRKILAETKTPGVGVSIVTRDKVIWTTGIGKADVAANKDATADTLFRIGSVSKSFASLSVLKLQEEGRLSLQDTVRSRAPEIAFTNRWEATDPIRIVNVLEHTTGWDDLALREYANSDPKPLTLKEGLDFDPRSRTSRWRPGTFFSYCNSGPPVAAYIVEKVTGMRFEDYVRQNFFAPIHMDTADYFFPAEHKDLMAQLYQADGKTPYPYWHIIQRPAGSINASAREMGNYVQFFLNRGSSGGSQILTSASIDRMETPTSTLAAKEGLKAGYGLSNYTSVDNGFVFHGHDGGVEGGLTNLAYLPDDGVGYVFMINSGSGEAFEGIHQLLVNFVTKDLKKPGPPPAPHIPPAGLEPYLGYAIPVSPRQEKLGFLERLTGFVHVTFSNNKLTVAPLFGKPKVYLPVTDELFREEDSPVATLALIPQGRLLQGMSTYAPASAARVWVGVAIGAFCLVAMASAIPFALIWVPRKMFGRLKGVEHLSVRAIPLLGVTAFAAFGATVMVAFDDAITKLGNLTIWSGGFFVLGLVFAALAVLGFVQVIRAYKWGGSRGVWVHSTIVASANLVVTDYLVWCGVIGWRTWA